MNTTLPRYLDAAEAAALAAPLSDEFALLNNPPGIWPPYELVPLRKKYARLERGLRAVLVDMDGTTTLTEDLCLNALETMLRRITGWWTKEQWAGLEPQVDYPHIIGHSTTRNVEYLVAKYIGDIDLLELSAALVHAAAWTLRVAPNQERVADAQTTVAVLGFEPEVARAMAELGHAPDAEYAEVREQYLALPQRVARLDSRFQDNGGQVDPALIVRAAIDVYYQRLMSMFHDIDQGQGARVADSIYGDGRARAIQPLPGLGALHAIARGLLGEEAGNLAPLLLHDAVPEDEDRLARLGAYLERHPVAVALVTSSAAYECGIVLREVFAGLRDEVAKWPISEPRRKAILLAFESPEAFYDARITASLSHEFRLKPFRDLYSVALHTLGIPPSDCDQVIGFEDTEAGILAQRSAGVGVCVAVPFEGTADHDFRAASHVARAGLAEVLARHGLYLAPELLEDDVDLAGIKVNS